MPEGYRVCRPKASGRRTNSHAVYCGKVKPEFRDGVSQFKSKRDPRSGKVYLTNQCISCARASSTQYYRANPQLVKDRARQWKRDNPEKMKEFAKRERPARRKKEQSPEFRVAARKRFKEYYKRNRKKVLAANAARRRRKRAEARALVPAEVIAPFLNLAHRESSWTVIAERTGLQDKTLGAWAKGHGVLRPATVDQLATVLETFSLAEAVDRTREWADLKGLSWPEDFQTTRQLQDILKTGDV